MRCQDTGEIGQAICRRDGRFLEAHPIAETARFPAHSADSPGTEFSDFPTLKSMVFSMSIRRCPGLVLLPRCSWLCDNITTGCIGLNLNYIKTSVKKKNEKAVNYDWRLADEKWLLIVAAGGNLSEQAGGPEEQLWDDPELRTVLRIAFRQNLFLGESSLLVQIAETRSSNCLPEGQAAGAGIGAGDDPQAAEDIRGNRGRRFLRQPAFNARTPADPQRQFPGQVGQATRLGRSTASRKHSCPHSFGVTRRVHRAIDGPYRPMASVIAFQSGPFGITKRHFPLLRSAHRLPTARFSLESSVLQRSSPLCSTTRIGKVATGTTASGI